MADFFALRQGDVLPEFSLCIDAGDVRAYLDATGEPADHWRDSVPPLALGALALAGLLEEVPPPAGLVHTSQDFQFLELVLVGQALTGRVTVAQRSTRRGMLFTVFAFELRSSAAVVMRGRASVLFPGGDQQ